ncbi:MAG TPA: chorismate-binding protein, partial [Spirochaetota bacterium]|nr:chorismate-binding protein [Spirochaetota bacterium]HRS64016.1 chorismate-binding protein [Spirochaetota bacterium]
SANIAFYDGEKWLTPTKPLLYGTKREYLLEEGKIVEEEISTRDIKFFYKVSLINAMLDLEEIAIPVLNIF